MNAIFLSVLKMPNSQGLTPSRACYYFSPCNKFSIFSKKTAIRFSFLWVIILASHFISGTFVRLKQEIFVIYLIRLVIEKRWFSTALISSSLVLIFSSFLRKLLRSVHLLVYFCTFFGLFLYIFFIKDIEKFKNRCITFDNFVFNNLFY